MLNEEKIRLMTKAASYEAGEGKKALAMNKYFRGDYISINLIGSWISFTIAFAVCVGVWGFYHMDDFMETINTMDLPDMGKRLVFLYLGLLAVYQLIHYVIYHIRYQKNRRSLAAYNQILKQISHIYQTESKSGGSDFVGGAKEK